MYDDGDGRVSTVVCRSGGCESQVIFLGARSGYSARPKRRGCAGKAEEDFRNKGRTGGSNGMMLGGGHTRPYSDTRGMGMD